MSSMGSYLAWVWRIKSAHGYRRNMTGRTVFQIVNVIDVRTEMYGLNFSDRI
jgi:hypothetical protein